MKFSAALLAGGRSTRMTEDKAFLNWKGGLLWFVQLQKLIALGPEKIFIAARKEQCLPGDLASEVLGAKIIRVNDPVGEDCGPIGAITRCLSLADEPLLVLAVDMPAMSIEFLRDHLLSQACENKSVVYRGPHGFETLAAVYAQSSFAFFDSALSSGRFALQPLPSELAHAGLCTLLDLQRTDEPLFANANTPDEAARLLHFQNSSARA